MKKIGISLFILVYSQFCFSQGLPFCEHNSECPPWLGQLITEHGARNVDVCSVFLVGPSYVMTNRHCIAESFRAANSSCKKLHIHFPLTPEFQSEEVGCDQVVQTSDQLPPPLKWAVDLAVLKLERPLKRTPAPISTEVVKPSQVVDIFKVDPAPPGKSTPVIRKVSCSYAAMLMNPIFTVEPSPEMTLENCEVKKGNSGSPILNRSGKVVGILWGKAELRNLQDPKAEPQHFSLTAPFQCFQFSPDFKFSSNGLCRIDLKPHELAQVEKNYYEDGKESLEDSQNKSRISRQLDNSYANFKKKFQDNLQNYEKLDYRGLFAWIPKELRLKTEEQKTIWARHLPVPTCIKSEFLHLVARRDRLNLQKVVLEFPVPVFQLIRVTGDPDQFFIALADKKTMRVTTDISNHKKGMKLNMSYQVEINSTQTELSVVDLPECGPSI